MMFELWQVGLDIFYSFSVESIMHEDRASL